jgi:alpha-tubulin suppressor-like RCC1 family protein
MLAMRRQSTRRRVELVALLVVALVYGSVGAAVPAFASVPPSVTAVQPGSGPEAGGTTVAILGTKFGGATKVAIGGVSVPFTVKSNKKIVATTPAGSGKVNVRVTTPAGTSPKSSDAKFTYLPVPTVTSLSRTSGPPSGGTRVRINGTGFNQATKVTFGKSDATFRVRSNRLIVATSPASAVGAVQVRVRTPGGRSATGPASRYVYRPDRLELAGGTSHTCVGDSILLCWGGNWAGQLGDDTTNRRSTAWPVMKQWEPDFELLGIGATVAAGAAHTCSYVWPVHPYPEGVYCWGDNTEGQLGDGTTTNRRLPVEVSWSGASASALGVTAGEAHTCALRTNDRVACWGDNSQGQLGDGSTTDRITPVPVSGLRGALAVAAGSAHTCALRNTGRVLCWGDNGAGQLGDGTTTDRTTPTPVQGLTDAVSVAAGERHTCAVRTTGGVRCWGGNWGGQLGDGTTTSHATPVAVSGLTDAVTVSAGRGHSCAVLSAGNAACWGANRSGQLGDGTTTNRLTPVEVNGLADRNEIAAGHSHTCAMRGAGQSVACWGYNGEGQLGDGTTTSQSTPVEVQLHGNPWPGP